MYEENKGTTTPTDALIVANGNLPAGGTERMVVNLLRSLTQAGVRARALFPAEEQGERMLRWCADQGIGPDTARVTNAITYAQSARSGYGDIHALRRVAQEYRPRVINFHSTVEFIPLRDVMALRMAGPRKLFCSVHSFGKWEDMGKRRRTLTRLASLLSDGVIANSEATLGMLAEAGVPRRKLSVIYCGVRPPAYLPDRDASRQDFGVSPDTFLIVSASRLHDNKGVDQTIAAMGLALRRTSRKMLYLIAGDGPERAALEQQAKATLSPDTYRFLGRITNVDALYAAADLHVQPSYDEAFGLVYVEAGLHGVPSIGLKEGGVPEVVAHNETGMVVPRGETDALAEAILTLAASPDRLREMGNAARTRALTRFTDSVMGERYRDHLGLRPKSAPALALPHSAAAG